LVVIYDSRLFYNIEDGSGFIRNKHMQEEGVMVTFFGLFP